MSPVVDTIVRSSILLAVGLAALWLLRKQPAALRHWVLAAALAIAAAQPVMNQIIPALPMPAITWAAEAITPEPVGRDRASPSSWSSAAAVVAASRRQTGLASTRVHGVGGRRGNQPRDPAVRRDVADVARFAGATAADDRWHGCGGTGARAAGIAAPGPHARDQPSRVAGHLGRDRAGDSAAARRAELVRRSHSTRAGSRDGAPDSRATG